MSSDFDPRPDADREAGDVEADPGLGVDPESGVVSDPDAEVAPCAHTEYVRGPDVAELPATGADAEGLEREVWDALYEVEDPEMPVSVVDLGLIYGVEVDERAAAEGGDGEPETRATVLMTLTYTGCPARDMLTDEVREAAASPDGIDAASVELVWSPEWSLEMVTEQGKADLREFGLSV